MKHFLIYGLGNPGAQYAKTKHNIGRLMLESYVDHNNLSWNKSNGLLVSSVELIDIKLTFLVSIDHFMNESGKPFADYLRYHTNFDGVLIVQDDSDQQSGKSKLVTSGGSAGHKGVDSIYGSVSNSQQYYKLKLGIRPELNKQKSETFVLSGLSSVDNKLIVAISNVLFDQKFWTKLTTKTSDAVTTINSIDCTESNVIS